MPGCVAVRIDDAPRLERPLLTVFPASVQGADNHGAAKDHDLSAVGSAGDQVHVHRLERRWPVQGDIVFDYARDPLHRPDAVDKAGEDVAVERVVLRAVVVPLQRWVPVAAGVRPRLPDLGLGDHGRVARPQVEVEVAVAGVHGATCKHGRPACASRPALSRHSSLSGCAVSRQPLGEAAATCYGAALGAAPEHGSAAARRRARGRGPRG